ncbi:hypothetical protein OAR97_04765 [Arcobacteraceae bacterium]|nr:hypothetical protein [Arcobacteraceae bacterium]
MKAGFTRQLQKSDTYKQLQDIKIECCKYSLNREQSHTNYAKHCKDTKKPIIASYNSSRFSASQANLQKSSCITDIAIENDLVPLSMTLTLNKEYHYLKGIFNKKSESYLFYGENDKFEFDSIDNAIQSGYKLLNKFYREFLKEFSPKTSTCKICTFYIIIHMNFSQTLER